MTDLKGTTVNLPEPEGEESPVGGGTLTTDQVNAIIKDRLARQRAQILSQTSTQTTELEALRKEVEGLRSYKASRQEAATKVLEDKRKGLPEGVLKLLDKLDPDEQLAWIEANANELAVKPQVSAGPQTPRPNSGNGLVDPHLSVKRTSGDYSF